MTVLSTRRMFLELLAEQCHERFGSLCANPVMMRHVGRGEPWSTAQADTMFDRALAHWTRHGFGWRSATERATRQWLGIFVINFVGSQAIDVAEDEISVGWWIVPSRWGQGYAKEGAAVVVAEAFERLDAERVLALMHPSNDRSVRVAQSIGMELAQKTKDLHGEPLAVYELRRSQWEQQSPPKTAQLRVVAAG